LTDNAAPTPASAPAASARRRIGLFGGSFDPVHQAHLALARAALDQLALDELRWMPAGQPWQKSRALAPASHRAAMLALVVAGEPRFVLERCEIDRPGPSYTLDSLTALQVGAAAPERADWFLVIGQDQYANFARWHGWQQILQRATLAVAARADVAIEAPAELLCWWADQAAPHHPLRIDLPAHEHAATELRQRLSAGEDAHALAPVWLAPAVAGYIARHRLYAGNAPDFPLPPTGRP
jgi:nicotinate-nucleotide adenylyltransferase